MEYVKKVVCLSVAIACVCGRGAADSYYLWKGGQGEWSSAAMWEPGGVPKLSTGSTASIPAVNACVVGVTEDASAQRLNADAAQATGSVTLDIASGKTLTLDSMRIRAFSPMDFRIMGGGTLMVTNSSFGLGYTGTAPVQVTVSGQDTLFCMPKVGGADLCIGTLTDEGRAADNLLHVTDGARVFNATGICVGQGYDIDEDEVITCSGGRVLVDEGGTLESPYIYIGREDYYVPYGHGIVAAVTNGTIEATAELGIGQSYYTQFTGSNALLRVKRMELPRQGFLSRYLLADFVDSTFDVSSAFYSVSGGRYCTNNFTQCRIAAPTLAVAAGACWDSLAQFTACDLTCDSFRGGLTWNTSNVVFQVKDSTLFVTNHVIIGCDSGVKDVTCEIDGGSLRCKTFLIGKAGSLRCGTRLRNNVAMSVNEFIVGDSQLEGIPLGRGAWAELVGMTNVIPRLMVGVATIESWMQITNSAINVTSSKSGDGKWLSVTVGRDAGACSNVFDICDSTFEQVGGGISVGEKSYTSNNVMRLVNSTYTLTTRDNSGDIIVGYQQNANGNRLELFNSTLNYDRKWIAVGQNGSSNVLHLADHSTLSAPMSQLQLGYNPGAVGNRLELYNGSVVTVSELALRGNTVLECGGAGNVLTVDKVTFTDGDSFSFRPSAEAATNPVLTFNRKLVYNPNRPITVDAADVPPGNYCLVSGEEQLPEFDGVPITFKNVPDTCLARLYRSADRKSIWLGLSLKNTIILVR